MDKVENLEYVYQACGILEEECVTNSQCHSVLGSRVKLVCMQNMIQIHHSVIR